MSFHGGLPSEKIFVFFYCITPKQRRDNAGPTPEQHQNNAGQRRNNAGPTPEQRQNNAGQRRNNAGQRRNNNETTRSLVPGPWSLVRGPGPWSWSLVLVPVPWSLGPGPWSLVPGPWSLYPGLRIGPRIRDYWRIKKYCGLKDHGLF